MCVVDRLDGAEDASKWWRYGEQGESAVLEAEAAVTSGVSETQVGGDFEGGRTSVPQLGRRCMSVVAVLEVAEVVAMVGSVAVQRCLWCAEPSGAGVDCVEEYERWRRVKFRLEECFYSGDVVWRALESDVSDQEGVIRGCAAVCRRHGTQCGGGRDDRGGMQQDVGVRDGRCCTEVWGLRADDGKGGAMRDGCEGSVAVGNEATTAATGECAGGEAVVWWKRRGGDGE